MPSTKNRIQVYLNDRTYDAILKWMKEQGVTSQSEAVEKMVMVALNLPPDAPGDVVGELMNRLTQLEERVGILEGGESLGKSNGQLVTHSVSHQGCREGVTRELDGGLSNTRMAALLRTNKRTVQQIRDDPDTLADFCWQRVGKKYEYRNRKFYPID